MSAKQSGLIKVKGSIGGLTFYGKDGDTVRTTGGVERERILKDPAFKRTRENMAEFGGSAKVGKSLRKGLAIVIKLMGDSALVARITGLMKKINSLGNGVRGRRSFEILANKDLIEGFELSKTIALGGIFFAPYERPVLDANRNVCTWVIPDFSTDSYINAPEGATHFKLVLITSVLSDYTYQVAGKTFEPVSPNENEASAFEISGAIALGGSVGSDITLTADLGFAAALPDTVGVLSSIGIIFYQEINGQLYELATDNAMRIEAVG